MFNLKPFDIIQREYMDGFIQTAMILQRVNRPVTGIAYQIMFESADNGVEVMWYTVGALYNYSKVN